MSDKMWQRLVSRCVACAGCGTPAESTPEPVTPNATALTGYLADFCVNADKGWFATHHRHLPHDLADLARLRDNGAQQFQAAIPPTYGTYPTRERVELPDGWRSVAPMTPPAGEVATNQHRWRALWRR